MLKGNPGSIRHRPTCRNFRFFRHCNDVRNATRNYIVSYVGAISYKMNESNTVEYLCLHLTASNLSSAKNINKTINQIFKHNKLYIAVGSLLFAGLSFWHSENTINTTTEACERHQLKFAWIPLIVAEYTRLDPLLKKNNIMKLIN